MNTDKRINRHFEEVFAVGVDEMSWDDLLEENYDWTGLDDQGRVDYLARVQKYRDQVKDLVLDFIDKTELYLPITQKDIWWILIMGQEHEKIHFETSACIISQIPIDMMAGQGKFELPHYPIKTDQKAPENYMVTIKGKELNLGKKLDDKLWGWDNEYGHEKWSIKTFEASAMMVSNSEFMEFIQDGGYSKEQYWSKPGWAYVQRMKVTQPRWWIGQTHQRLLYKEVPIQWDWPVECNNMEGAAFCNWKGEKMGKTLRLISYEESYVMRDEANETESNLNLSYYSSPAPVDQFYGFVDGQKVYDLAGNVWRHSCSVLTIMEGFKPHPVYDDFSSPTIDGEHTHVIGGSWISMGNCANIESRYGFRPHFM